MSGRSAKQIAASERRRKIAEPELREMVEGVPPDEIDTEALARHFGVDARSICRALIQYGLREPRRAYDLPMEWLKTVAEEGLPNTWAAETLGVGEYIVSSRIKDLGVDTAERNLEWKRTWAAISHHPHLVELHREFAPRSAA